MTRIKVLVYEPGINTPTEKILKPAYPDRASAIRTARQLAEEDIARLLENDRAGGVKFKILEDETTEAVTVICCYVAASDKRLKDVENESSYVFEEVAG